MKRVAEVREALAKSRMKSDDERCRRAQERVQRYSAIKILEREIEEQEEHGEQTQQQMRDHRKKMQKFVNCADYYMHIEVKTVLLLLLLLVFMILESGQRIF